MTITVMTATPQEREQQLAFEQRTIEQQQQREDVTNGAAAGTSRPHAILDVITVLLGSPYTCTVEAPSTNGVATIVAAAVPPEPELQTPETQAEEPPPPLQDAAMNGTTVVVATAATGAWTDCPRASYLLLTALLPSVAAPSVPAPHPNFSQETIFENGTSVLTALTAGASPRREPWCSLV